MLKTGEAAPDFSLHTTDGEPVSLQSMLQNHHHALLVFLRHLG